MQMANKVERAVGGLGVLGEIEGIELGEGVERLRRGGRAGDGRDLVVEVVRHEGDGDRRNKDLLEHLQGLRIMFRCERAEAAEQMANYRWRKKVSPFFWA